MKKISVFLLFLFFAVLGVSQPIKVMVVTGGHAFDTLQFFQMFDGMHGLEYEHFEQPTANKELAKGKGNDFDVLVFYDMWKSISETEKAAYLRLTKAGKPMLFLHHSLASYQNWNEFEKILGGRYVEKGKKVPEEEQSNYEHDVWLYCSVVRRTPITASFTQLRFFDEAYGNVRITDSIEPLLRTKHPKSMEYVAWRNVYNKSNIIYIQPGHDKRTFAEPSYKQLLKQAIVYLAGTN